LSIKAKNQHIVIAHRGACGYLPEHTLEAKALAYGMGADYLEQDVVATRDDELIVLHDIHMDTVTDVAIRYPNRARVDGRYYARDFDLAEIKTLNVHERRKEDGITAVFPGRFPTTEGYFSVTTLAEEITMIQGLNKASGRNTGIYPEVKSPVFHAEEGVDVSQLLLQMLQRFGYTDKESPVYVQCFDAKEVARIREELGCQLKIIQLIGENSWGESDTDYDVLKTADGLKDIARFADGIGPWAPQLYTIADIDGEAVSTGMVSKAHAVGLAVHPYTFRADAMLPGFDTFPEMVEWFAGTLSIDGFFTDFPDKVINALAAI
jgi:glycerophosphoryl diester phosphodiesterase